MRWWRVAVWGVAGLLSACSAVRDDEALAMLDVAAATGVPGFESFCFSVDGRPEIATHDVYAAPARRMKFGYYLPGPSGPVEIRAQALAPMGQVVGEGMVTVRIEVGRVSDIVLLPVGTVDLSPSRCRRGDAGRDGGADALANADGAAGDTAGDAGLDGRTADGAVADGAAADGRADASGDGQTGDAGAEARADAMADASAGDVGDARADAGHDGPADASPDTAPDGPTDGSTDARDAPPPCTACMTGMTRTESADCGCRAGRRSRTLTCSGTCAWVPGAWSECDEPEDPEHACSVVDYCTRLAAPECRQTGCTPTRALAECKTEVTRICGNAPAPTMAYCD